MGQRARVLLTGGSGFLGRKVAALLRGRHDILHFDACDPADDLPWVCGDVRDAAAVEQACREVDAIVHLAALHGRTWDEAGDYGGFDTNVMGTFNILEGARKGGAGRVVFTSSTWAAGHCPVPPPYLPVDEEVPREPIEAYGLTKKLGEQMCRFASERHGVSTICLRPGGIVPEDAPLARRLSLLFDCVDVRDVAQAHLLALEAPEEIRLATFVTQADSPLCGVDPTQFFTEPIGCLERVRPGMERLVESGVLHFFLPVEWYSIEKAHDALGYSPRHTFEVPSESEGES